MNKFRSYQKLMYPKTQRKQLLLEVYYNLINLKPNVENF